MDIIFEWDKNKNNLNISKHGLSFDDVKEVFYDPFALELYDDNHSSDEDRYIIIGDIGGFIIVTTVYTERQNTIRIISARFATKKEEKFYHDNFIEKTRRT